jgi:translation initiation factor IF-1
MAKSFQMNLPLFFPRQFKLTERQFQIWLSAWLDTEGSIYLRTIGKSKHLQLWISQKDVVPLKMIQEKIGGGIYPDKGIFRWGLGGYRAASVLKDIANYLVVKKDKAINAIQYYETKAEKNRIELPLFYPRKRRLTETQFLIWLAAWLDTEGCITLQGNCNDGDSKGKERRCNITITQNDIVPLKMMQKKVGGTIYGNYGGKDRAYRWKINGYQAVSMLRKITDYLVVKKQKAINVIEYYELKQAKKINPVVNEQYRSLVNTSWETSRSANAN